jgi:hypothetical protein
MRTARAVSLFLAGCVSAGCDDTRPWPAASPPDTHAGHESCNHDEVVEPRHVEAADPGPIDTVSVAHLDRPTSAVAHRDPTLPVEARLLVIAAASTGSELEAMKSVLQHRGVPFDVLDASSETLTTSRLQTSSTHGNYQGIILTSASLAVNGVSQLSPGEWTALADYEQAFAIRRAVLTASPDPAMGWSTSYSTQSTTSTPLDITCAAAGLAVFRDVNCDVTQQIHGGTVYLATPASASLTPLLQDGSGHALAAIHTGSDGRESLLLLSRQDPYRVHSHQFLHGVLNWVSGGTWLGERRIDMGLQIDDVFLATDIYTGGRYRLSDADLHAVLAWVQWRRAQPSTPGFQLTMAFNGVRATDGDPLTEAARATAAEWDWVTHTFNHHHLDDKGYNFAFNEFMQNIALADSSMHLRFDAAGFVAPNISGFVNPEVMQAAVDAGIRYAVTDSSKPGCDNPTPNLAFYNRLQPSMLLIPRRPGGMPFHVSTPTEWIAYYNAVEGGTFTYAEIIEDKADMLFRYMMKGEADPWMYHQANLRAYDGVTPLIGDLIDEVVDKVQRRLRVPMRTPDMRENAERFVRRINFEGAGVRATLYRGRALVIDAGRSVTFPVTGVRAQDGESYGGDVIRMVTVEPGTSTCIPLDAAGLGCAPSPGRPGGAGPVTPLPTNYCDGSADQGFPPEHVDVVLPRGSTWRYWDQGGLSSSSWRERTFDDAAWAQGAGPLGYGEPYIATTVAYGSSTSNRHITTYFRRTFDVADPSIVMGIVGRVMYDDGFVAYLNGTEIARAGLPSGEISSTTLASGHVAHNSHNYFNWDAARSLLRAGSNTLAFEVHQQTATSGDLVFDAEIQLEVPADPSPPPTTHGVPRQPAIGSALRR